MLFRVARPYFWVPRFEDRVVARPRKFIDGQFQPGQRLHFQSGDIGPVVAGVPDIIIGSIGTPYTSGVDASSYTATGLPSVGASERGVIAIAGRAASTRTINSVTVGGNACAVLHTVDNSGTTVAIYVGPVGASGDVAITLSAAWLRATVALWPCQNIQSATPTDTGGATAADPLNDSMNCGAGGAIFGIAYNANGSNFDWTNLTEAFDVVPESGNVTSGAADVFSAAQTGRSITADPPGNNSNALALVALR